MKGVLTAISVILGTALLALATHTAQAEVVYYHWKDKNGRPVHSDRPPPKGVDYQVISTGSSFVRPVDSAQGAVPLQVKPTARNNFDPVNTAKKSVLKNPEYCARARENLEMLNNTTRIRMRNSQGELYDISESERDSQKTQARESIKKYC